MEALLVKSVAKQEQVLDNILEGNTIVQNVRTNFCIDDFGGFAHHLTLVQALIAKKLISDNRKPIKDFKNDYPKLVIADGHKLQRTTVGLSMFGRWFSSACVGS